ncbi:MAG TPA: hypothetical protein GX504_10605 [Clostridia bacterium]|nr:hypothetical protein [Clostridia bacterium]
MPVPLKTLFYNLGYFWQEVKTSIRLNLWTSFFSAASIGLILFILAAVLAGWWTSQHFVAMLSREAEISVFWQEGLAEEEVAALVGEVEALAGVREVRIVSAEEAYQRMAEILGREAGVLALFESNPFVPYIEVKPVLAESVEVVEGIRELPGIAYVRDNREILARLQGLVRVLEVLGYAGLAAVTVAALIIISHIIKLSFYARRSQIYTLELLGAPGSFIAVPFLLEGLLIALLGGLLAMALVLPAVHLVAGQLSGLLPFLSLPDPGAMGWKLAGLLAGLSAAFGLAGSLLGLSTAKM